MKKSLALKAVVITATLSAALLAAPTKPSMPAPGVSEIKVETAPVVRHYKVLNEIMQLTNR